MYHCVILDDDDALERLATNIPDMRIRLGMKCAFSNNVLHICLRIT